MPKYPYRVLGTFLNRVFRKRLNDNFKDIEEDLKEQKQRVDDLIISNPQPDEAQDARGGFPLLRDRLDNYDKKLGYKQKQTELLSYFYDQLRASQPVIVAVQGDSEVYGYDITSADIRPADPIPTDDGTLHGVTRASISYPEALQEYVNQVYGAGIVTVLNRGYGGDWVTRGMQHWNNNPGAHLHFLGYGINDSRHANCPYKGDVVEFIKQYRLLIERTLDWGSAVVLVLPFKGKPNTSVERKVDVFAEAVRHLGLEYGVPVVDAEEMLRGYSAKIWSDNTHLNGIGYRIIGARLMAVLIGDGVMNPFKVINGTTSLLNHQLDSFQLKGNVSSFTSTGYPSPDSTVEGEGYALWLQDPNAEVYLSFFADEDDIIVIPSMYTGLDNETITVELDFGTEQAQHMIDYVKHDQDRIFVSEPSTVTINTTDLGINGVYWENDIRDGKVPYIHITSKGWHVIKIKQSITGAEGLKLHAVHFRNYSTVFEATGVFTGYTSYDGFSTNEVLESRIKWVPLLKQLGLFNYSTYYMDFPILNIEVNNFGLCHDTYEVQIVRANEADKLILFGLISRAFISAAYTPRIISNITYDAATDEIVITWGGNTTRQAGFFISVGSVGGNVKIYPPLSIAPAPVRGGFYFDGTANKFKKCVDGSTWIDA